MLLCAVFSFGIKFLSTNNFFLLSNITTPSCTVKLLPLVLSPPNNDSIVTFPVGPLEALEGHYVRSPSGALSCLNKSNTLILSLQERCCSPVITLTALLQPAPFRLEPRAETSTAAQSHKSRAERDNHLPGTASCTSETSAMKEISCSTYHSYWYSNTPQYSKRWQMRGL